MCYFSKNSTNIVLNICNSVMFFVTTFRSLFSRNTNDVFLQDRVHSLALCKKICVVLSHGEGVSCISVADQERFGTDQDSTTCVDTDPGPNFT